MLGRLARWLRLLGFDTLYYNDIKDGDLLKIAVREGRIILTRDSHFLKRKKNMRLLMVHSDHPAEQVKEVLTSLCVTEFELGRCPDCNGILHPADNAEAVRDMVPDHIFVAGGVFLLCRSCQKVYWEGTHLKRFREKLDAILKENGSGVQP